MKRKKEKKAKGKRVKIVEQEVTQELVPIDMERKFAEEKLSLSKIETAKTYDISTLEKTAKLFAESGMFPDSKSMSQCFVKIMAGREWGINPFSAMQNINIIQGKPAMSGALISSLIKKSGKYNYKVHEHTNKNCRIEFFEEGKSVGESVFGEVQATIITTRENGQTIRLIDKYNYKSYPEAMYFNRALTKGARMYCPDVFDGSIYVPEELTGIEKQVQGESEHVSAPQSNVGTITHATTPPQASEPRQGQKNGSRSDSEPSGSGSSGGEKRKIHLNKVGMDDVIGFGKFKAETFSSVPSWWFEWLVLNCDEETKVKVVPVMNTRIFNSVKEKIEKLGGNDSDLQRFIESNYQVQNFSELSHEQKKDVIAYLDKELKNAEKK
jgi:hypothetical protein